MDIVVFGRTPAKLEQLRDTFGFATATDLDGIYADLVLRLDRSPRSTQACSWPTARRDLDAALDGVTRWSFRAPAKASPPRELAGSDSAGRRR